MRITIVMPTYNAMPYLQLAVTSILRQSFQDLSLVVIDDCSTDNSLEYLDSLADPRLTVLRMQRHQGQGAARNLVLRNCETDYVAFADADDVSLPRRLELQVAHLDRFPEIGMLGTGIEYIGRTGKAGFSPPIALDHTTIRADLLRGRHAVINGTLMFRTCAFKRTGLFRINGAGEDWDLFLRMTEETGVANLPEVLAHIRLHGTSTNAQQAQTLRLRYAHACECAKLREESFPESSFEDFCERQLRRSAWTRHMDQLEHLSARHYRKAVVEILEGSPVRGHGLLALAALVAPRKVLERASRKARLLFR